VDPNQEKYLEAQHQIRVLKGQVLNNQVEVMLLDFEMAVRKAFPNPVDVKLTASKIVAYLREHMVAE